MWSHLTSEINEMTTVSLCCCPTRFQGSSSSCELNLQTLAAAWCDLMATGHTSLDVNMLSSDPVTDGHLYKSGSNSGKFLLVDAHLIWPNPGILGRGNSGD